MQNWVRWKEPLYYLAPLCDEWRFKSHHSSQQLPESLIIGSITNFSWSKLKWQKKYIGSRLCRVTVSTNKTNYRNVLLAGTAKKDFGLGILNFLKNCFIFLADNNIYQPLKFSQFYSAYYSLLFVFVDHSLRSWQQDNPLIKHPEYNGLK